MTKRRLTLGMVFCAFVGALIYFSARTAHEIAVELKPFTVHLVFSDEVKRRIAETHAALGVQAIVTDREITAPTAELGVLDHREQTVRPGEDKASFDKKSLELETSPTHAPLDPVLTLQVVTRFENPAGNCIHCEPKVLKVQTLKEGQNQIDLRCDGWLNVGICVQPK